MNQLKQNRRIIVLRHGERLDFTFGSSWIKKNYTREDANMPEALPPRDFNHWVNDTPLTKFGDYQAHLLGSSLKDSGVKFSHVFVSPAFRCLQTATGVLRGMGQEIETPLNVDFGLFEWVGFYKKNFPTWLSNKEFERFFNINTRYEPTISRDEVRNIASESIEEFYNRNSKTTRDLLKNCDGDVLIVAHAANLDTCTRQLLGKQPRKKIELRNLLISTPYLAAIAMKQTGESSFELIDPPCLPLTHDSSSKFDWKIFEKDLVETPAKSSNEILKKKLVADLISKL